MMSFASFACYSFPGVTSQFVCLFVFAKMCPSILQIIYLMSFWCTRLCISSPCVTIQCTCLYVCVCVCVHMLVPFFLYHHSSDINRVHSLVFSLLLVPHPSTSVCVCDCVQLCPSFCTTIHLMPFEVFFLSGFTSQCECLCLFVYGCSLLSAPLFI